MRERMSPSAWATKKKPVITMEASTSGAPRRLIGVKYTRKMKRVKLRRKTSLT